MKNALLVLLIIGAITSFRYNPIISVLIISGILFYWYRKHKNKQMEQLQQAEAPFDSALRATNPDIVKLCITDLQNMNILECVPESILNRWVIMAANNNDRAAIPPEEIKIYFPTITKNEMNYIRSSIQHTVRARVKIDELYNDGYKYCVWRSGACPRHTKLEQLIFPTKLQIPHEITKDQTTIGAIYPGQGYRCLCYADPLIIADQVSVEPICFYNGSTIKNITKDDVDHLIPLEMRGE